MAVPTLGCMPEQDNRVLLCHDWTIDIYWLLLSKGSGESNSTAIVRVDQLVEGGRERGMATLLWTNAKVGAIDGFVKDVKKNSGDDCVQPKVLEESIQGKVGNT